MKKTLIAAVMFLALSAAAFAQSSFTVASTPETFVACCGLTEKTGDIAFTAVPGTPDTVLGTLTITYPVPVTNTFVAGVAQNVSAIWTAGSIGGTPGTIPFASSPFTTVPTVSNIDGKGTVVIPVPAGAVAPFSIRLSGIRVNVSGACSGSISATITSTGNLLTSGETSVVVISNVAQALRTPTATPVSINAVTGVQSATSVTVNVKENFLDAFGKIAGATGDVSQTTAKRIRLTFSKIPTGVTFTFPATAGMFSLVDAVGDAATIFTLDSSTTPGSVYYQLTTNSDPTVLETLAVPVTVSNIGPYPLASGSVTVSAHVGPIDERTTSTVIPRYTGDAACETGTATVLRIAGASTTLLVPYAVNIPGSYNTGLAIANTTSDPGVAVTGIATAVKQTGSIRFDFYPQTGATFNYVTAADSPGEGLEDDGTLATGRLYAVLLSQLLEAAGAEQDFAGYIFITTNFTNAHGQYFISDFEFFTNGALMLVVNRDDNTTRANPESLNN